MTVAALIGAMIVFDSSENRDTDIVLAVVMMALSFPASVVVAGSYAALLMSLESAFGFSLGPGRAAMAINWLGLFAAGYFQWFCVVPYGWQQYPRFISNRKRSLGSH